MLSLPTAYDLVAQLVGYGVPLSNHNGTCYATARMNRVRQLRESRHLTQVQLGLLPGVQPAAVGRRERGEVLPRKRMRRKLARQLGFTEEELAFDHLRG